MFTQPRNSCDVEPLLQRTSPFPEGLHWHPDGLQWQRLRLRSPGSAVSRLKRRPDGEIE